MCAASLLEKVLFNRQVEVDSLHPTRAGKTRAAVQYGEVVVEHKVAWFEQKFELVCGLYDDAGEFLIGALPLFHFVEGHMMRCVGEIAGTDLREPARIKREDRIGDLTFEILLPTMKYYGSFA